MSVHNRQDLRHIEFGLRVDASRPSIRPGIELTQSPCFPSAPSDLARAGDNNWGRAGRYCPILCLSTPKPASVVELDANGYGTRRLTAGFEMGDTEVGASRSVCVLVVGAETIDRVQGGYPSPNVVFRNDTDFLVTVRTRYTSSSITVEMWGNNNGRTMIGSHSGGRTSTWISRSGDVTARKVTWLVSGSATYDDGGSVTVRRWLSTGGSVTSQVWTHRYIGG